MSDARMPSLRDKLLEQERHRLEKLEEETVKKEVERKKKKK